MRKVLNFNAKWAFSKETKEIQNDLPFNTPLPKADTILPLEEEDSLPKEPAPLIQEEQTLNFEENPKNATTSEEVTPEQQETKNKLEEEPAQIKTEEIIDNAMGQDDIK